ncbi:hypothetical protein Asppvi_003707 [Aspergillus pseudoviridinutans]|uniref:Uncharacterized protein n=1 Tax=Aspergillus pseudoviridinutans TaxID=1517512 RepID=A0A9P3B4Y9_9EURO|nr:uncharacterized protein Asppvi_003707 [Aspergillus pseudoviridinutans]GIJ84856.1 hypothetical protein Asppvi_003707 [Aspergillus pseudoviridinutans]
MTPIPQHQSNEWVFITTTPTRPRPTKGQRSQMRRRVMREIGYTRRNVQTALFQSPSISSCTSSDITASDSGSSPSPVERQYGSSQSPECPTSSTHIPSFLASPVVLDRESQRLLHHMFSDAIPSQFRIYKDRWYPICITNSAAFDQMLATYATHISQYHMQHDLKHFILSNHTKALVRVRNDISAMSLGRKRVLEGTLSAITALACYSHLQRDMVFWRSHMAAVARLIQESGLSLGALDEKLVTVVKWVDLIGSYALDVAPALGDVNEGVGYIHSPTKSVSPCLDSLDLPASLLSALQSLQWTNAQIVLHDSIWSDPVEVDRLIHPLTHHFLSLRYDAYTFGPVCSGLRSGALLYLAEFRRMSGISPVVTEIHVRQLRLSMEAISPASLPSELTLWLLTVGALEATTTSERKFFHSHLLLLSQALEIHSVLCWKRRLKRLIWSEAVFDHKLDITWGLLQAKSANNHIQRTYIVTA